ncbi:MAG: mechanosensitive ion channel family protein [Candidatus Woesearchaeota archaeon]
MIDTEVAIQTMISGAPRLIGAILVIVVGWILAKFLIRALDKNMQGRKIEATARIFLVNILDKVLKIAILISAVSFLGVEMASFVAILAAMAFAVGLALQGSLSNFAGGVLIILFRLYKKGDFIEAQGQMGTVEKIEIFHTTLKTPQNQVIIVPNGPLANGTIKNFSVMPTRRADWSFGISYEDDFEKAKKIILKILEKDKRVLKDPEPFVKVGELGDSSVNITTRAWVKSADFWGVMFDTTEAVKKEFDKQKISIPYPQMDVHMKK